MSDRNVISPVPAGPALPSHRGLWWGAAAVVAIAVAAVAVVCVLETKPDDLAKLQAQYDRLVADGRSDEAVALMLDVRAQAVKLCEARRFDEARKAAEWIVSKDPKCGMALNILGLLESARAETEARLANEKLGLKPTEAPKVLPNYDKAADFFKRAASADPLTPDYHNNLAGVYFKQKKYEECEKELEIAMRTGLRAHYHLLYARCAEELKRPPEVIRQRLHDTVTCAEAQANALAKGKLPIPQAVGDVWKDAARRLAERGDDFGWEFIRRTSESSRYPEVRELAASLLKGAAKP